MDPQQYDDLMQQLVAMRVVAMRAKHLRWIADQDPTRTQLKAALEEECVSMQMDSKALLDFCAKLEAN